MDSSSSEGDRSPLNEGEELDPYGGPDQAENDEDYSGQGYGNEPAEEEDSSSQADSSSQPATPDVENQQPGEESDSQGSERSPDSGQDQEAFEGADDDDSRNSADQSDPDMIPTADDPDDPDDDSRNSANQSDLDMSQGEEEGEGSPEASLGTDDSQESDDGAEPPLGDEGEFPQGAEGGVDEEGGDDKSLSDQETFLNVGGEESSGDDEGEEVSAFGQSKEMVGVKDEDESESSKDGEEEEVTRVAQAMDEGVVEAIVDSPQQELLGAGKAAAAAAAEEEEEDSDDDDDDLNVKSMGAYAAKAESSDDSSEEEDEEGVGELIADIFGSSDEEDDFQGFSAADLGPAAVQKTERKALVSDDDEDDSDTVETVKFKEKKIESDESSDELEDAAGAVKGKPSKMFGRSDFEVMMEKKKAENQAYRRRKKRNVDIINDNDDIIVAMINKMKQAAEEDRELNQNGKAAVNKLKLFPLVLSQLKKQDLHLTFIDCGVLAAIKEWLLPLPDRSLPHLKIREGLLKCLTELPAADRHLLKTSGIGKAVMYLYKHPKEIRANKELAGRLISEWSRPIFGVEANFKSMSKEERERRDHEQMPKRRRLSSTEEGLNRANRSIDTALQGDLRGLKPGDKGWVGRARVPIPSLRDYVNRPKSNIDPDMVFMKGAKTEKSRLDKQMLKFKQKKQASKNKNMRAVSISIEGRKMTL